ncbi:MAG TPA: N-acetyl-1-D-myo-inositol-2-amino-2-deoxy-alpha-D-glucopyranoside deacetylase [Streptosporangiaceae bacterium]|nr:N-acetyl-1-D-myo-inositol-2-amino-2-deoxy-alpha-D-glucopyranoside deacetylase [Streptosporangiaceae bacterium]
MSPHRDWRRLLLVHAHPDDESIGTGGIMAKYAAEGAQVTLVTCTLGELGEVIPADLDHLRAERADRLGEHRIGELAAACAALGVTDHRFLGGPGRWRDSGMMGTTANDDPRCFWRAGVDEAAAALTGVIRTVRPQVIVTYDQHGGYGHPDHIQAHRVAWRAFERSAGEQWRVAKFYAHAVPQQVLAEAMETVRAAGSQFGSVVAPADLPSGVPDENVTTEIDVTPYLETKLAAMRAHATQISVYGQFFALSNNVGQLALGHEYFTLLAGPLGKIAWPQGREDDLFAALS